jgi:hypothetical protein
MKKLLKYKGLTIIEEYDSKGNLISWRDSKGYKITFVYSNKTNNKTKKLNARKLVELKYTLLDD